VFELDDEQGCVCFQSECLLPDDGSNRTRVLLLFSNAHPLSIKKGMFHTAESGVAKLWMDLRTTDLFAASKIRKHRIGGELQYLKQTSRFLHKSQITTHNSQFTRTKPHLSEMYALCMMAWVLEKHRRDSFPILAPD
jgi:hypothetical protein